MATLLSTVTFGGDVHDVSTVEAARATSRYAENVLAIERETLARKVSETLSSTHSSRVEVDELLGAFQLLARQVEEIGEVYAARADERAWAETLTLFKTV